MLGRRLAGVSQFAMAAIDGPAHGGRAGGRSCRNLYAEKGFDNVINGMVDDWMATLGLFLGDGLHRRRAGWIRRFLYGVPFRSVLRGRGGGQAALRRHWARNALERREQAGGNDALGDRFRRDAPNVHVPALFHMQWDDELFSRESQSDLFDLIGSEDKRMVCYMGPHGRSSPEAVDDWCRFLEKHLR